MRVKKLAVLGLIALPFASLGDDAEQRYEDLVDEIMEVTGALEIGDHVQAVVMGQLIRALKASGSDLPDRAYELIQIEVQMMIEEEREAGTLNELIYPVYAKHLDEKDLEALLAFYATKEGRKIAEATPLMAVDAMTAGEELGAALEPKITQRLQRRLAEEGVELHSAPADDFPSPGSYQATPKDYARVENLGDFFGSWRGVLLPVHDPKGVWRDNPQGLEFEAELGDDIIQVSFTVGTEWVTVTTGDARGYFIDSALIISEVYVESQSFAFSLILQRSSSDRANAWVLYTGGNPYLPDEHIWSSYGALATGIIQRN